MKKLTLPTSIRIGPYDIEVRALDPVRATARNVYGSANRSAHWVEIDQSQLPEVQFQTFLHEIQHMIIGIYDIDIKDEENLVTVMAMAWMQIYRDNPEFMTYLNNATKALRKGK